ncbi:sugar phosphate isomerase/epimerase family protein [Runella slithyformis]|uniref:Xylose isomerase domain-containing protein TIM barrel n=1 Tax=Runella slithyformis (strain ATCC 29530 / DSM 19594 / LMG 11500 / NCIMB 11436 / LSU 4) TaxID=761193 RepID=A0A7U3ZPR5_RUNSL|nr:sugar phosphate isomerase/epimerase [Runella slithyformis]AEI51053.1 Xylose isomerase domain-containing protein TIM barrel [Runella slithyformis DSM 19594]
METNQLNRRNFLSLLPAVSLTSFIQTPKAAAFPIAANVYNWMTFYTREGKPWGEDLDRNIGDVAKTGLKAFEPSFSDKNQALNYIAALKKHGIAMPSIYVGSILHEAEAIEKSIATILEIADVVKTYGTKIIVTNPNPQKGGVLKNDAQLVLQAQAMERLGSELRKKGLTLAYHTHDVELKAGAREFHHILLNTTPENVAFCFDVHWVYRGTENSQAAVFDVLKLYGKRIVELHVRQSVNGVWAETFTAEGDIDYRRLVRELSAMKIRPHVVIEQCLETKSPNTMNVVEAHTKDLEVVKETFKTLL